MRIELSELLSIQRRVKGLAIAVSDMAIHAEAYSVPDAVVNRLGEAATCLQDAITSLTDACDAMSEKVPT
jgi:hypothetical protein